MVTLRHLLITDAEPSADALGTLTVDSQQFEYKVILCTSAAPRAILRCCELPQLTCSPPGCCAFTVTSRLSASYLRRLLQVAVADMDLKPLEKIDEHFELDCAIMREAKRQRLAALLS